MLMAVCSSLSCWGQKVEIQIQGIRSAKGQLIVAVFTDEENFRHDQPVQRKRYDKKKLSEGKIELELELPSGTYGIAVLDDENMDDDITSNRIGYPVEGFGFSGYFHSSLRRPAFKDFSFTLAEDQERMVDVKIKYM